MDTAVGVVTADGGVEVGLGVANSSAGDCAAGVSTGGDIGAGVGSAAQAATVISAVANAAVRTLIDVIREVSGTLHPYGSLLVLHLIGCTVGQKR